jgi:hypothetical protein
MPADLVDLAPLLLGVLLGWTGLAKLTSRALARQAADSALMRVLRDAGKVTLALRTLGAVELLVALGLLAAPGWPVPGVLCAALGVGFLGYLGYARITAPDSSCGCGGGAHAPITWRAFVRAGLVVAGGALAAGAGGAWWSLLAERPAVTLGVVIASVAVLGMLSTDLDHVWLLPLRKARLRVFGHPLGGTLPGPVPVAATVELLERSLAWGAAAPIVRSALIEHWDADGWRVLRYAGVCGDRPVSVLFALDVHATTDSASPPAVRVTVVDEQAQEVIPEPPLAWPEQWQLLPIAP